MQQPVPNDLADVQLLRRAAVTMDCGVANHVEVVVIMTGFLAFRRNFFESTSNRLLNVFGVVGFRWASREDVPFLHVGLAVPRLLLLTYVVVVVAVRQMYNT